MAQHTLLDLPSIPQHIVQRGNNRPPCFLDDADRRRYLVLLREALLSSYCALHACVPVDNHVHILVTPPRKGYITRMMHKLGRKYVGLFNARHGRTSSLWEGRYKLCLVDSEDYVIRCRRYIDLNPIRARIIDDPAAYRCSSCSAHCGTNDALLASHPSYLALGRSLAERAHAYRNLLAEALSGEDIREIRIDLQQQRALDRSDFQAMVEAKTQHFARARPAHGPYKPPES
jgi:putative transposase